MKKIFSILMLSFLAFFAKGQMQQINAFGYSYNGLEARKIFNIPSGVIGDTALSANYYKALKPGAMFYDSVNNTRYIWRHAALGDYWAVDNTGGGGGGGGGGTDVDTIFVTPIGTQAGMKQALYAVDGNLRVTNFGVGYGMGIGQQADSLIFYFIDTTQIAYKQWIINQYGVGTGGIIAGLDGVLAVDQNLTANRHAGMGPFSWTIDGTSANPLLHLFKHGTGYGILVEGDAGTAAIAGFGGGGGTGVYGSESTGNGVYGTASAGGIGVNGNSQSGFGGFFQSATGTPLFIRSDGTITNDVVNVATFYRNLGGGGIAAIGLGGQISMQSVDAISQPQFSNALEWRWSQMSPSLVSEFLIIGLNGGSPQFEMKLQGNGEVDFPNASSSWGTYANNAAAVAAGKPVGRLYFNSTSNSIGIVQ